ncbi:protein kinase, putative [Trypanosoma brucei brucei TREU927]|uniref:Protein kinase, putative n=1 Tax=Trypanosoma brucei brucei (strain 927/4 GUTat10.1) TaxID=185431 RepID=Q57YD1_TRYB2|nr:protein kinase, putative [Trypanosoma brucei brucei TREU927]AAX69403.1 protein kinase, putative [Trypanosoma brucei]AAZ12385.1 protein kinase, putative [Trypanosoma brucei brucei TREU927]
MLLHYRTLAMATSRKQVVGKYELGKVLASGYFDCRTRICTHIVTGAQYVVRIYSKSTLAEAQWMWDRTRDAIHVMRTLPKHENIIEISELFETESSLYILMQLFAPMHLTKMYTTVGESGQRERVPIQRTKALFLQVVRGLRHMHDCSVVHLGLAPDHVMVNDRDHVKIGNLVSCKYVPKGTKLCRDIRGTMHTVAPEVLRNGEYDPYLADSWSMGVLLYFMLHNGRYPHDGANTTKNILYNRIRPPDPKLPAEALNLLQQLLSHNPGSRMRVEQIADHPFFATEHKDVDTGRTEQQAARYTGVVPNLWASRTAHIPVVLRAPLKERVQYSGNREDAAAYLIQMCYKAFRGRKRRFSDRFLSTQPRGSINRSRSQVVEVVCPSSRSRRRKNYQTPHGDTEAAFGQERTHLSSQHYQQRWSAVTNTEMQQGELGSRTSSINSGFAKCGEGPADPAEGSSFFGFSGSESEGSPMNATQGSHFNFSLKSGNLPLTLPPLRRQGGPCKLGCDPTLDAPVGTPPNSTFDGPDNASPTTASVCNEVVRAASFRLRVPSMLHLKAAEAFSRDLDLRGPGFTHFNTRVDPGRRCPVCDRPPAQRMNRKQPYLNTPYEYKEGKFTIKTVADSD